MATPQGNFTAYQQLKPTELKVGDIYNKAIDELIKNNQAQQAAALKQKMQQNQSLDKLIYDIGDSFKGGIKTTSAMASFASDYTKQTGDRYGQLMYNASLTTDPAEKQRYLQEALRLKNGYEALKASLQSMDYDNVANNDNQILTKGQAWAGDNKIYVRTLFGSGALKPTRGEDGNYYVAVPKGANAKPDDPAEMVPINDFFSRYYGKGLEVDITQNFLDDVMKDGFKARDDSKESYNKDGNGMLRFTKALSDKDRKGILDKYFNIDEKDFDVSKVNRGIYQLFYNKYGKYMENFDDYKAIRGVVDEYIKTGVSTSTRNEQEQKTPKFNINNYNSSGGKATANAVNEVSSGEIYATGDDGKNYKHNVAFIPTSKGNNGNYNPTISVAYNRDTKTFSYFKTFQSETERYLVGKKTNESLALTIIRNNIENKASAKLILKALKNTASGLYGKGVPVGDVNMRIYNGGKKSKGGGKGKPF